MKYPREFWLVLAGIMYACDFIQRRKHERNNRVGQQR